MDNLLQILSKKKFYLKKIPDIEQCTKVYTIDFDKTDTITTSIELEISKEVTNFSNNQLIILKNVLRASNHLLSRILYGFLQGKTQVPIADFEEMAGQGIQAIVDGLRTKVGSAIL